MYLYLIQHINVSAMYYMYTNAHIHYLLSSPLPAQMFTAQTERDSV